MTDDAKTPTPQATAAKAVRRALAAARKAGDLNSVPEHLVIRVKSESFAGGCAVRVVLEGAYSWAWTPTGDPYNPVEISRECRALAAALRSMLVAAIDATGAASYMWGSVVTEDGATVEHIAAGYWTPGSD
jgi:hypothetical protein